ncbi:MAG: hypothetical protein CMF25_05425 [Kangiellaceae bacterium]|nr:hypothetical protein [Kangiellaceae bacterium]
MANKPPILAWVIKPGYEPFSVDGEFMNSAFPLKPLKAALIALGMTTLIAGCSDVDYDKDSDVSTPAPQVPEPSPEPAPEPEPSPGIDTSNYPDYLSRKHSDEIFYFVMLDRFNNGDTSNDNGAEDGIAAGGYDPANANRYHGGDIQGLIDKLDYIQGMGATALWVTPVVTNLLNRGDIYGYHGYWGVDFMNVDPHLGSNDDFKALVDQAHARNMKVYLDIVLNHTGDIIKLPSTAYRDTSQAPYEPGFPEAHPEWATVKSPEWLNDTSNYNNRGNSTFSGESALLGDFNGNDDLDTSQQDVIDGWIDIYKHWIETYKVDGFRIDTVKHVDIELWQQFSPQILDFAKQQGIPNFSMFGEVAEAAPEETSYYTSTGQLPSALDFSIRGATRDVFSRGVGTSQLAGVFEADDLYNAAHTDARSITNFLDNHDQGRWGTFLKDDDASRTDDDLVARSVVSAAAITFSRGAPVFYYGFEQGFTGNGESDTQARQDMFANPNSPYKGNDIIASEQDPSEDNFNTTHPIYQELKVISDLYKAHPALRSGVHIQRYSSGQSGILAFSRVIPQERMEYLVVLNSDTIEKTQSIKTGTAGSEFAPVWPQDAVPLTADESGNVEVTLGGLDFAIYKASSAMPAPAAVSEVTLAGIEAEENEDGEVVTPVVRGRIELEASASGAEELTKAVFEISVDGGDYQVIGEDWVSPYRVYWDSTSLASSTGNISVRATMQNLEGSGATSEEMIAIVDNREIGSITLNYENGNNRDDIAVLFEDGGVLGPVPLVNNAATFVVNKPAQPFMVIYESRDVSNADVFSFDTPVWVTSDTFFAAATANGNTLNAELFINNNHQVANTNNFVGSGTPTTLPTAMDAPAPYGETELFVRGGMNGWDAVDGMEYIGNYTYKATLNIDGESEFKFADATWSEINLGRPATESGLTLGPNPGNLLFNSPQVATYDFYLFNIPTETRSYVFQHIVQQDAGDIGPLGVAMYLRGSMNGWDTSVPLNYDGDNHYSATAALSAQSYAFKFADENWTPATNFGFAPDATSMEINVGQAAGITTGEETQDINVTVSNEGDYVFTLDVTDPLAPTVEVSQ